MLISVLVAVLVLAGAGGAALYLLRGSDQSGAQETAASAFGRAWTGGNLATLAFAPGAEDPAGSIQKITAGLTAEKTDKPSDVSPGTVTESDSGETASVPLTVTWSLAKDQEWSYESTLTLVKQNDAWLPEYSPELVHPELTGTLATATLDASTLPGRRGQIVGANDKVLVEDREVVTVGIQKSRADDVKKTVNQVANIVEVDGAALLKRVEAAGGDVFVEVITLRRAAYDKVEPKLKPIPGTVFQTKDLSLPPTSDFARPLFGTVGTATADIVEESGGRVQAGDETGLSGLQRTYDEQLSGTPGVVVTAAVPDQEDSEKELFRAEPSNGENLQITLDEDVQKAADKALGSAKKLAGMVAIDTKTGNILAIANGGPNGNSYNRALLGQYAPGSTFKVASTFGLLEFGGMTANKTVACPATLAVGGKTFKNAEDEVLGRTSFANDFAHSCNTAFVGSAKLISQEELAEAAKSLGYGQPNSTGVTAYLGQVPTEGDTVEHAASMIGQSKVLASPLNVASASAAVAEGTWHAPKLVLNGKPSSDEKSEEPTTEDGEVASSAEPTDEEAAEETLAEVEPVKLNADAAKTLRSLMRGVVTNGTATALKGVPGGPVSGKTGTAEYGSDTPPRTHAWFTGFQGDIAFAVVVEDGGFGAQTAVPLVKKFLADLA
ncbi:penicillin-binding transpeptidase domain-containing protein [Kineosporia babensis]